MIRFYITRHGETLWNTQKRMQGHKDSPLTELGIMQAESLAGALKDIVFEAAYSSSSRRALQTARIIVGDRDVPVVPMDGLMEINLGGWEGLTFSEVEKLYPEEYITYSEYPHRYKPAAGESFEALVGRAGRTMETLAKRHNDGNLLVVTHGVTLKAIAAYVEKRDIKDIWSGEYIRQASLNLLEYEDGKWNPVVWGDVSHYEVQTALS